MVLTTVSEAQAPLEARYLLSRARTEVPPEVGRAIIELVATIISYKFGQISRKDVEEMLDIRLQETRVYQDIKEEGRQEGAADLALQLLTAKFGPLSEEIREAVAEKPLPTLKALVDATLKLSSVGDLQVWLETH